MISPCEWVDVASTTLPDELNVEALLHCTLALWVVGSTYSSVMVDWVGEAEYGVRIPTLAAKKLLRSVSATDIDCEVRSESVRATSVTLRSTATPDENSTTPKNITIISGTIMTNSVAATPRQSFDNSAAARAKRNHRCDIGMMLSPASSKARYGMRPSPSAIACCPTSSR